MNNRDESPRHQALPKSTIERLPIIGSWLARRRAVDAETIQILGELVEEDAYQRARALSRLAREKRDHEMEVFFRKVARRISQVTGRRVGPKEYGERRYGDPTHRIDGEEIVRIGARRKSTA